MNKVAKAAKSHEHIARDPLFHVTKRDDIAWWKSILFRLAAVLLALAVSALFIILLTGVNPLRIFKAMYDGNFGSSRKMWNLFQNSAMLLGISLAVTPAFKMRFWNIGAEGQVLIGCLASVACMFYIKDSLPSWALILVMLAASIVASMIWAGIPGIFKAAWNTNETLFTLMMNYVAIQLVNYMILVWVPNGSMNLPSLNSRSKAGWLPSFLGQKYMINILIVLALTLFVYIYLKYSKHGYEISVVGESENTARYVGINVKKVIIRTVLFSGALCGIIGWLLVAGKNHMINATSVGGDGFTAIMVSWLAKFNPLYMILNAVLICFLQGGTSNLASDPSLKLDTSLGDIITGIVILFIIGSEFFVRYKINFRKHSKEEVQPK